VRSDAARSKVVKATILTTQLPIDHWHGWLGDATVADAILDRPMQRIQRIDLTGESMRRPTTRQPRKLPE